MSIGHLIGQPFSELAAFSLISHFVNKAFSQSFYWVILLSAGYFINSMLPESAMVHETRDLLMKGKAQYG
jgi:hypothetical protein